MVKHTYFDATWLYDLRFKEWIQKVKGTNEKFGCRCCGKELSLSNMGVQAVISHMGKPDSAHAKKFAQFKPPPKQSFFKKIMRPTKRNASEEPCSSSATVDLTEKNNSQKEPSNKIIKLCFDEDACVNAEILWAFHSVRQGYSARSCDSLPELFQAMFPIIGKEDFKMRRHKLSYLVNFGLAPYVKEELIYCVKRSEFYSISFDETLNDKM